MWSPSSALRQNTYLVQKRINFGEINSTQLVTPKLKFIQAEPRLAIITRKRTNCETYSLMFTSTYIHYSSSTATARHRISPSEVTPKIRPENFFHHWKLCSCSPISSNKKTQIPWWHIAQSVYYYYYSTLLSNLSLPICARARGGEKISAWKGS
jgi:hypothetical protein